MHDDKTSVLHLFKILSLPLQTLFILNDLADLQISSIKLFFLIFCIENNHLVLRLKKHTKVNLFEGRIRIQISNGIARHSIVPNQKYCKILRCEISILFRPMTLPLIVYLNLDFKSYLLIIPKSVYIGRYNTFYFLTNNSCTKSAIPITAIDFMYAPIETQIIYINKKNSNNFDVSGEDFANIDPGYRVQRILLIAYFYSLAPIKVAFIRHLLVMHIPFAKNVSNRHALFHVSPIDLLYIPLCYKDNDSYRIHFIQ